MHKIIAWFHGLSTPQKAMVITGVIGVPILIYYVHKNGLGLPTNTLNSGLTSPVPYGDPNILGVPSSGGLGDTGTSVGGTPITSQPVDTSGGNSTVPVDNGGQYPPTYDTNNPINIPGVSGDSGYYPPTDPYGYGNSFGPQNGDVTSSPYSNQSTNTDQTPNSNGLGPSTSISANTKSKSKPKHTASKPHKNRSSIGGKTYQGNATFTKNVRDIASSFASRVTTHRPKTAKQAHNINQHIHRVAAQAANAISQSSTLGRTSHVNTRRPQEKPIKIGSRVYQGNATFTHGSNRTQVQHPVNPARSSVGVTGERIYHNMTTPTHQTFTRVAVSRPAPKPLPTRAAPNKYQKPSSAGRGVRLV